MLIQCTKKLLNQLKVDMGKQMNEKPLFSWHANLIRVNQRKTVILINDKNNYVIVLYGLKKNDFKQLDKHIIEAIQRTFAKEYINSKIVEDFIASSPKISYTTTKNRSLVARLNYACKNSKYFSELMNDDLIFQPAISRKLSHRLVGDDGENDYMRPAEEMFEDIKNLSGRKNIFNCRAVRLTVTLNLEEHNVWRQLIVPFNITFRELHEIIQKAFNWHDYHLHEFYIFGSEVSEQFPFSYPGFEKEFKPVINLVSSKETLNYPEKGIPMKLEKIIKISEYLPAPIIYNYDYGDYWQHFIEVEEVIDDYDKNFPVCIDGEGKTPPEDVGGEEGYERFLKIIKDKEHKQYEQMINWGRRQGYSEFDIKKINNRLK